MIRNSIHGILLATLVAAVINFAPSLYASGGAVFGVPEISPSAASGAIAVLAASGLMLAERLGFRRK